jgi:hypothetical protein
MGTWITHLRIAEILFIQIPGLDEAQFTYGNLAPDSGLPNSDWTQFEPPREVTHCYLAGQDEGEVQDLVFYTHHVESDTLASHPEKYSFLLSYYCHLLCDHLWWNKIGAPTKALNASLFENHTKGEAWGLIKDDWYGLDHLYVKERPDSLFWRVLMKTPNPVIPLPTIPQAAFAHQMDYIKSYYSQPDESRVLARPFPFLNRPTVDQFIQDVCIITMKVLRKFPLLPRPFLQKSAVELLTKKEFSPFPPPLGDVIG